MEHSPETTDVAIPHLKNEIVDIDSVAIIYQISNNLIDSILNISEGLIQKKGQF